MQSSDTTDTIMWKSEYNVHDTHIDSEHQRLFNIAKKAEKAHEFDDERDRKIYMGEILREVYSFTKFHFKSEEEYMKKNDYPNIEAHQAMHKDLLDKINFIVVNLSIYSIERAEKELYHFIQKIFLDHIMIKDREISDYINNSA